MNKKKESDSIVGTRAAMNHENNHDNSNHAEQHGSQVPGPPQLEGTLLAPNRTAKLCMYRIIFAV